MAAGKEAEGKLVDSYEVEADRVLAKVKIERTAKEFVPLYVLQLPELKPGTLALLDSVRERILNETGIRTAELLEPKAFDDLKAKFFERAYEMLRRDLSDENQGTWEFLAGMLVHDMLGLGKVELLLADNNLEDLVINSAEEPVWVYHKRHGWTKTNVFLSSEAQIQNYSAIIGRRVGRQITTLNPLMDAHLPTGDRVNSTLFPISTRGNTISIRKFRRRPWVITDVLESGTIDLDVASFLWSSMQYENNMIVAGGTASGKTTFLNVLLPFIPPNQRIISIEDTREIELPRFLHWVPLTTREPNPEGKGEVSMLDLLVNSLRMRPDRILVGEVRRGEQAEVMFEAMHTGHSVYATLHADTAEQTFRRMINPPINVPETMMEALHMIVVMFRDRRRGIRRVFQIAEVVPGSDRNPAHLNVIYKWDPVKDRMVQVSESKRIRQELEMHTGMTRHEFDKELAEKKEILKWMWKNKIQTVDGVGKAVFEYYFDPARVLKIVERGGKAEEIVPAELLKMD